MAGKVYVEARPRVIHFLDFYRHWGERTLCARVVLAMERVARVSLGQGQGHSPGLSDDQLVVAARCGRGEAADALVRRYLARVYGLCRRMLGNVADAEDAAQDTMLKAMRGLAGYRTEGAFDRWMLKIAANTCITVMRKRGPTVALDGLGGDPQDRGGGDGEADEYLAAVERALPCLPERQWAAVVLFHFQGWSLKEVAEVLAIPEGTVRSSLHRVRVKLREMIVPNGADCENGDAV